jgi:hypothetical protein
MQLSRGFGVVSLFLLLCSDSKIKAQEIEKKPTYRVRLRFTDEAPSEFRSYINRELRSLYDVSIVESEPGFWVLINVMKIPAVGGGDLGYAVSIQGLKCLPNGLLNDKMFKCMDPVEREYIKQVLDGCMILKHNSQIVGNNDKLRVMAEGLVADLDTALFEPERKENALIADYLKSVKTQTNQPSIKKQE